MLEVVGLSKSYKAKKALNNISFQLKQGEALGLLGANGAGKTTCFYLITGMIAPDEGRIFLNQTDITTKPVYQRAQMGIGYLPQETSIFRGLNVEENILAILEICESQPHMRQEKLETLLHDFSISHLRHTPAPALSGGECRRVEIARALASSPSFILLDEPFAGIDPIAVDDIRVLVGQLKNRGVGVLITDHNVRETLHTVERALIIHNGSLLLEGGRDDVLANPDVRKFYLGSQFKM